MEEAFEETCDDILAPFPNAAVKEVSRDWFYAGAIAVFRLCAGHPDKVAEVNDELLAWAKKQIQVWRRSN